MTVRSASVSSRIEPSLAMAVGVVSDVFRIGSRALLALGQQLRRRRVPAGDEDAGKVVRRDQPQRTCPRRGREALEVADLALAEDQDASGLEVLVEAREREAGLLDVGAGDDADRCRRRRPAARW